jgi:Na+-transporting NADH:ubiquinone oxidoreductase subunit C
MRDKTWYPVLYMFVATAFFISILIGLSTSTRDRVEANERLSVEKAVLEALPIDLPTEASSLELHQMFVDRVSGPSAAAGGAYLLKEDGQIVAYAVPLEGKGYWDTIKGFIGIASDGSTVTGISFFEQKETPGLGAEIAQRPFRSQFVGKRIAKGDRPLGFLPVGSALGESEVHTITGATQTSTRVERIINEDVVSWRASLRSTGDTGS